MTTKAPKKTRPARKPNTKRLQALRRGLHDGTIKPASVAPVR